VPWFTSFTTSNGELTKSAKKKIQILWVSGIFSTGSAQRDLKDPHEQEDLQKVGVQVFVFLFSF